MQLIDGVPLSEFIQSTRTEGGGTIQDQGRSQHDSSRPATGEVDDANFTAATQVEPPTAVQLFRSLQQDQNDAAAACGRAESRIKVLPRPTSPDHFRKVAAMVRDVASALSYAHQPLVMHISMVFCTAT